MSTDPITYDIANALILNACIKACADGEKGYAAAAADANDTDLKILLQRFSDQRAAFVLQLEEMMRSNGTFPDAKPSVAGAVHRGWVDLRMAIGGRNDFTILEECARGDRAALHAYERALGGKLEAMTHDMRMLVQGQYGSIRAGLDELEGRLRLRAP
jgi:uncharacterized protein (TIGR02284 family)